MRKYREKHRCLIQLQLVLFQPIFLNMAISLDDNTTKVLIALVAVVTGSTLLSIRYIRKKNSKKIVNQNRNTVNNGDIVAGNKTTNS